MVEAAAEAMWFGPPVWTAPVVRELHQPRYLAMARAALRAAFAVRAGGPPAPGAGCRVWRAGDAEPDMGERGLRVADRYGVAWVPDERSVDGFEGWRSDSHGFSYEWCTWEQLTSQRGPVAETSAASRQRR